MKFDNLGLTEAILKAVSAEGYDHPTPIQTQAIPLLLNGQDLIGIAQTGTGKTAAFVLPLLHRINLQDRIRQPKKCRALILSPTRELAAQIVDNIRNYARFTDIKAALIVGGVRPASQIKQLKAGVDIVVATPGRLLDHANSGAIDLAQTHNLVIDEADQMLDLGFLPDIRRILGRLPTKRQTALLSATMPGQIRKLTEDFLTSPTEIRVAAAAKPIERIAQSVRHVAKADKRRVLTDILADNNVERTVVFARTKRGADRVCKHLIAAGLDAVAIHGDKSQGQRDRAMEAFRSGKASILVATDIAARGIDIDDVSHVVNFELPNVPEAYVHRIGRTARAGKSGTAISLCDPDELKLLKDIERLTGCRIANPSGVDHPPMTGKPDKPNNAAKRKPVRGRGAKYGRPSHKRRKNKKPPFNAHDQEQSKDGLNRMFSNIESPPSKTAA